MINLTLRQLRYFEALARHGHFGQAAAACSVSQPALSVQIKDMEETLGAPLFERGTRQARLTGFGEALAPRVREILGAVDELGEMARATRGRLIGRLRIGVIPTVAPYLLPRVIAALTRGYPGIDLHIRETLTETLIDELTGGRIDCAIVALPISESGLTEVALFDEDFMLVRPRADADKPVPDREKLREMRLLLLEEGHCFRDQALSFCNIRSALSRDGLDGSSLTTLVQMVGAGIGVTLIPEMAVAVETRSADVAVSAFTEVRPSRTIGMIWRKTSPLAAQLAELATVVRAAGTGAARETRPGSAPGPRGPGGAG
ncbi:LysR substrate-binding domain-containing protein [Marinovum sp. SP66]|uniref:hydrogen peroxide-inducible genes activator n=1 Tax=Marinovum TaxID=367771 RepID=UPI00065B2FD8|nr:hydrogen peroxide-inducible genes activator [Marinovum sp. SP66]AKO98261.1 Transcriptional regulator [Marinovum algicola DG 898]MDD9742210.1 LysR substrate-binding domain-containing protein [Marinovum sp. SP66]